MDDKKMKNLVVLKNLPSNIIDEAFIVLKDNKKVKNIESINNRFSGNYDKEQNSSEYVVKEAEIVVQDYIQKLETEENKFSKNGKKIKDEYRKLKSINKLLGIMLIMSIIMVILK